MNILKRYKDKPVNPWLPISRKECTELTEGRGYWKPGTIREILAAGKETALQTPWAEYKFTV